MFSKSPCSFWKENVAYYRLFSEKNCLKIFVTSNLSSQKLIFEKQIKNWKKIFFGEKSEPNHKLDSDLIPRLLKIFEKLKNSKTI